jgi:RNA polymerase sigma-70 factor, ECF subfamily
MALLSLRSHRSDERPLVTEEELLLLTRLRAGEEQAFITLVSRHHDAMLRLARTFVHSHALAEEIVQDTWIGVLNGIDRFEGRSKLRTWLLAILVNRARTTGAREARSIPTADPTPAVDPSRFDSSGAWSAPPAQWVEDVEDRVGAEALRGVIRGALEQMPPRQRAVVMLRDVDGLASGEVCQVLDLTPANERVLLHRGRSRLRQVLEDTIGAC